MTRSRYEFYQDNRSEWRWRKIAANNQIVGNSGEGFKTRHGAVHNAQLNGYEGEGIQNVIRKAK